MLTYVGVLDDKSLEYPFGLNRSIARVSDAYLLSHCLFTRAPVLEEGFILASEEARTAGVTSKILLTAVRSGLFKVASKTRDLQATTESRRTVQHESPPDTADGRRYVDDLQNGCVQSGGFVEYAPKDVDQLTFHRLAGLVQGGGAEELERLWLKIPKDLQARLDDQYAHGNNGRQWTARAAFEAAVKAAFPGDALAIQALMCAANRERQIIRGAALAVANGQPVEVETGFSPRRHDLASHDGAEGKPAPRPNGRIFPLVSIDVLRTCHLEMFEKMSDPRSGISTAKTAYLDVFEACLSPSFTGDLSELERKAKHYEEEIYAAADCLPLEQMEVAKAVMSFGAGAAIDPLAKLLTMRREKNHEPIRFSRRDLLRMGGMGAAASVLFGSELLEPVYVTTLRHGRTVDTYDTGDLDVGIMRRRGVSHERLVIDTLAAERLMQA